MSFVLDKVFYNFGNRRRLNFCNSVSLLPEGINRNIRNDVNEVIFVISRLVDNLFGVIIEPFNLFKESNPK